MSDTLNSDDVSKLLSDPTPENRATAAKKVSEQFSSGKLTDEERVIAEDIFKVMVKDVEVRVREALSESLKDSGDVPHDVALALANDVSEVALPMLEFSEVLTDDDLKSLVQSRESDSQQAIARRENVSADLAETIVDSSKDEDVVAALVSNEGADLQEKVMDKVIDKYGESEKVNTPLAERGELPIGIAERLVNLVSEKVRDHLVTHHEMSPDMVMDLFFSARERATVSLISDNKNSMDVQALVDQLHENGRLTETLVFRALCMGDVVFFEAALAKLSNIPVSNAYKLIHDRGSLGLEAIFKESGLSPNLLPLIMVALDVVDEMNVCASEDPERFKSRMVERLLTHCEDSMDTESLDYFITKIAQGANTEAA